MPWEREREESRLSVSLSVTMFRSKQGCLLVVKTGCVCRTREATVG